MSAAALRSGAGAPARIAIVLVLLSLVAVGSAVDAPRSEADVTYGRFAFIQSFNGGRTYQVVTSGPTGGGRDTVSSHRVHGRPAWSPDGERIAFSAPLGQGTRGRFAIFVMNANGSGLRQLTNPRFGDFDPAWQPDGSAIAFLRDTTGTTRSVNCCSLAVMRPDGSGERVIANTRGSGAPSWSPTGGHLVASQYGALRVFDRFSGAARTVYSGRSEQPAWSPDGTSIAFVRRLTADRSQLATVSSLGGNLRIRVDQGAQAESPTWADDSRTVFFVSYRGRGYEGRTAALVQRSNVDGSAVPLFRLSPYVYHLAYVPKNGAIRDTPVAGNWNNTGEGGIGVARPYGSVLRWILREETGPGGIDYDYPFGRATDIPITGSWVQPNRWGQGVVRQDGTRLQWSVRWDPGGPGVSRSFHYGNIADKPVTGDWNGNGRHTPGVTRTVNGRMQWLLRDHMSGGNANRIFYYAQGTDIPIAGDWDGDGIFTPGVVRAVNGRWIWLLRNSQSDGHADITVNYGTPSTDIPVVGDWDGDGTTTIGVARRLSNDLEWHTRDTLTSGTTNRRFIFGRP